VRKEQITTPKYQKDTEEELFLQHLNDALVPLEEETYREVGEVYPTLHIIGVPRSGTTLLSQLICAHTNIGCINNLIAAFWKAPTVGIRLSRKLGIGGTSNFQSFFGRTRGVGEPHEFGYFWHHLLGYPELAYQGPDFEDRIDWDRVRLVLTNMAHAYSRPIALKSFLLIWHMKKVQSVMPKTCFVYIKRDPIDNALSLLHCRREFLGSADKWASIKPAEYTKLKDADYPVQIAGQIYYLERQIERQIDEIREKNTLTMTYEKLCANPAYELSRVLDLLNTFGAKVSLVSTPPKSFNHHRNPNKDKEKTYIKNAFSRIDRDYL